MSEGRCYLCGKPGDGMTGERFDHKEWSPVGGDVSDRVHDLRVLPLYYDALVSGDKTFEVRRNDRAFQRGDMLRLQEWDPGRACRYTGRRCLRRVLYVYSGDPRFGGIEPGYVVLALGEVARGDAT